MDYLFDRKQYKKFCKKKFKCCIKCHNKAKPGYPPLHFSSISAGMGLNEIVELSVCCNAPIPTKKDYEILLSKCEEGRLTSNTDPYDN